MNAEGWDVLAAWLSHLHNSHQRDRGGRWHKFLFLHLEHKGRHPNKPLPQNILSNFLAELNDPKKIVFSQCFWRRRKTVISNIKDWFHRCFLIVASLKVMCCILNLKCQWFIFDQNSFLWIWYVCRLFTMLPVLLNLPQIGLFTTSEGGLTCSYLQINLGKHNPQYQQSSHQY